MTRPILTLAAGAAVLTALSAVAGVALSPRRRLKLRRRAGPAGPAGRGHADDEARADDCRLMSAAGMDPGAGPGMGMGPGKWAWNGPGHWGPG